MIHVIHENPDWLGPLSRELDAAGLAWRPWFVDDLAIDPGATPPEGLFLNRMSASAHTRGHHAAAQSTRELLGWLAAHGRRVVNGPNAFELELSKARQLAALRQAGIRTPRSNAVIGGAAKLVEVASGFDRPFIVKPNRGGKGLGVRLFDSIDSLRRDIDTDQLDETVDGVWIIQDYIRAAEPFITRCEFVDGRFQYAIMSDTTAGFELCPAEGCGAGDPQSIFSRRDSVDPKLIAAYEALLRAARIDVAGIEFIEDSDGVVWTYDINCNTNYSPAVESAHGLNATARIVEMLGHLLEEQSKADLSGADCPATPCMC